MSARNTRRRSPVEPHDVTDWKRVRDMTEEEVEAGAVSDPDNPPWTEDELKHARVVRAALSKAGDLGACRRGRAAVVP